MSDTQFVEALSTDPYVRELHRKAVRILNDPSLSRPQREVLIRKIQAALLEHLARQAAKTVTAGKKQVRPRSASGSSPLGAVADQSQLVARRKEMGSDGTAVDEPAESKKPPPVAVVSASQTRATRRPVLSLKV